MFLSNCVIAMCHYVQLFERKQQNCNKLMGTNWQTCGSLNFYWTNQGKCKSNKSSAYDQGIYKKGSYTGVALVQNRTLKQRLLSCHTFLQI